LIYQFDYNCFVGPFLLYDNLLSGNLRPRISLHNKEALWNRGETMRSLLNNFSTMLALLVTTSIILVSSGCSTVDHEGFAIYLTAEDIPPDRMEMLSHVNIADKPVISIEDVVSYNGRTHELQLTETAFERLCRLDVPVRGKSFLVCIDKSPVYWGAFWSPVSSLSFGGVAIMKPLMPREPGTIRLNLGYPSASFYGGQDLRNNSEVMNSLEQAGKLIEKP